ncbi:MAG: long-chain fatty acid--CoA ligase [archaeon]|nr:long-chain fatty acid--CoA ligase [archaeon]
MNITTKIDENFPWFHPDVWPSGIVKNITYDDTKIMYDVLVEQAAKIPDARVTWYGETYMTYKELLDRTDRFATGLLKIGVKKGDVVAICLANCHQYVISSYACQKIGAISTGINPAYKPMEALHQLEITGADYIIMLDLLSAKSRLGPIFDKYDFKGVIVTNLLDLAPGIKGAKKLMLKAVRLLVKPKVSVIHKFKDLLNNSPDSPRAEIDTENDPATYLMTGGTTGVPKAAVLSHKNAYVNALQSAEYCFKLEFPKDRVPEDGVGFDCCLVGIIPLFHSFAYTAIMNSSIIAGGWMQLFSLPPKEKVLLDTWKKLKIDRGMFYVGAEVLFQRLVEFEEIDDYKDVLKKLSGAVCGAGPLHPHIRDKFLEKTGLDVVQGYGLTEASPVVSVGSYIDGKVACKGTIGLPIPGIEWKIFPTSDFEAGPIDVRTAEEAGELCVSGPNVMKGYLNEPERTAATIKEYDGKKWLLTGDIAYTDDMGRMIICDRKKQLIKVKGYSVFPTEVESMLGKNDAVLEAAVAGIPDSVTGEMVKAWVKVSAESNITSENLLDWCKENMTHYKVPKEIDFIDEIPKSIIGKVQRRQLKEADPRWKAANPDK